MDILDSLIGDLSDFERGVLITTHNRHLSSMGTDQAKNHQLKNIVKISRNFKDNCFNVYYDNGDWYHYTLSNDWY